MSATSPMTFETSGEGETIALGVAVARVLRAGDTIALEGELGAGKTRFVRGLARGLGHDEAAVSSPTYVLAHEYSGGSASPVLVHIDAYRMRSGEDLEAVGWDRLADGRTIVAIEWPERIAEAIPVGALRVRIEHAGGDRRRITMSWSDQPGEATRTPGAAVVEGWATRLGSLHYHSGDA